MYLKLLDQMNSGTLILKKKLRCNAQFVEEPVAAGSVLSASPKQAVVRFELPFTQ